MIKPTTPLKPGAIMQLNPDPAITGNPMFCACLGIVTGPAQHGDQGARLSIPLTGANARQGARAIYDASWSEMEPTGGMAVWVAK